MRIPFRQHPVIILVALSIVAALVWGFWPRPILVEIAGVIKAPLTVAIEEEGRTRVKDRYVVSAPVDGMTCRVDLEVGDRIDQGQVLLSISPMLSQVLDPRSRAQAEAKVSALQSALSAAREQSESSKATSEFFTKEVDRLRPLVDQGVISHEAFDKAMMEKLTADAALRSARFTVEVAKYELETARTALQHSAATETGDPAERVLVRAPVDGRILKIQHKCEGVVRAGEPLLEVGAPTQLEVEVDVLSADAVKIEPGTPVLFDRWGGDAPLEGQVTLIEPVGFTKISALGVEEQRVLVIADFTSPPERWQRLGDGYRVEAQFIIWQENDVLQVPASSLFRVKDDWAVFKIHEGRAEIKLVEVGQRNGLVAQVLSGLSEEDKVINHPSEEIEDGSRVRPR
jgi:HlyD family secretion protein